MKIGRLFLVTLMALWACLAVAIPRALIVQYSADAKDASSSIGMANSLARALEDTGKMDTVVWSMGDPVFRAAVLDGKVASAPDQPTIPQLLEVARALHCDIAMTVTTGLKGTAVSSKLDVYRGGRVAWSNAQEMDPGRASIMDLDNAVRSIARTWAMKLSEEMLKDVEVQPKPPETPAPATGQLPTPATQAAPKPEPQDSNKLLAQYQQKMSLGRVTEALIFLREAIDAHPLDAPLRKAYIQHLASAGRSAEAAAEARRASDLIPEDQELRAMAARAFLSSGKGDQAMAELNEALARNPNDPVARAMAADLAMEGLRFAEALSHLDAALRVMPSKPLFYRRAMVYGILGNLDSAQSDLDVAVQANAGSSGEDWDMFCVSVLDSALDRTAGDLRSLAQRLAVRREDTDAQQELEAQLSLLKMRGDFLARWPSTELHRKSSRSRALALSLLSQSLSGFKAFVADNNEDTLTDANIDLGEAIKQLKAAREALTAEGRKTG